jgi:hypothetical protein
VEAVRVFGTDTVATREPALVISREVIDGWNFLYQFITDTEFALCLEGRREGSRLIITGFRLAHIIASQYHRVQYVPCAGENFVGSAHNHPDSGYPNAEPCYQSKIDEKSFRGNRKAEVDIIICGRNRFAWMLRDTKELRVWANEPASNAAR